MDKFRLFIYINKRILPDKLNRENFFFKPNEFDFFKK